MIHQVGVGLEKVKEAKIKQANRVNDLHARKGSGMIKLPLEKDDICTISIPKAIKSAVKKLQVMVTDLVYNRDGVCYKVCSKHGHLTGTLVDQKLKELLRIDPSIDNFKSKLSL